MWKSATEVRVYRFIVKEHKENYQANSSELCCQDNNGRVNITVATANQFGPIGWPNMLIRMQL